MMLSFPCIQSRIHDAIAVFCRNDAFLLEKGLNERSVVHKLACYIQQLFPEYDVDCEYNRMWNSGGGNVSKEVSEESNLSGYPEGQSVEINDLKGKTVYPDIIIHDRKTERKNLLIVEVKKESYAKEYQGKPRKADHEKIQKCMSKSNLGYKYGLYLEFIEEGVCCEQSKRFLPEETNFCEEINENDPIM